MKQVTFIASSLVLATVLINSAVRADTVTEWNHNFELAAKAAAQLPPIEARAAAIVQVAVFDAVNGIERTYQPYFVSETPPPGARADAAAAAAAYTALKALYPSQAATLDAEFASTLANLPGASGKSQSIPRGLAWGAHVANLILGLRSTDGFSAVLPGYFGGGAPGVWRSLPVGMNADGTLPAVLPQFRFVAPFTLTSPNQFRPGPPPALTSQQYADDVNETKALGRADSAVRTVDQTQFALLWQAVSTTSTLRYGSA